MTITEIFLFSFVPSLVAYQYLTKKKEKKSINSHLVKNLFKEVQFVDYVDSKITAKDINSDLEYIGLNISRKSFTMIKMYISVLVPVTYIVVSFFTLKVINFKQILFISLGMFLFLATLQDVLIKLIAKLIQANIRFEFVNLIGAWSRNIELGSNFIAALDKSSYLTKGTLKKFSKQLLSDIKASTPLDVALIKFGQACRDKEINEFCEQMAIDIKDGADISSYIADINTRIQNDKASVINSGTNIWMTILSSLTGVVIFFTFAICIMIYAMNTLR